METAALIFLTGYLGYQIANSKEYLRNVSDKDFGPEDMPKNEKPNSLNIYNSNRTQAIDDELLQMSINQYKKSEDPSLTGVLPPIFNSYNTVGDNSLALKDILTKQPSTQVLSEMNHTNKYIDFAKKPEPTLENRPMFKSAYNTELAQDFSNFGNGPSSNVTTSILTGLPIDRDHTNMVPFFGGSVKQNIEQYANVATLDNFTGSIDTFIHKQEQTPRFESVKQDINPVSLSIETDRYIPSRFKQNEKPFEQQHITAQIADTLNNPINDAAASFPTIDQLRTSNNPQISYNAPLKSGQYGSVRGTQAKFAKNQPDTHYKLGTDRLFTDVGRSKDRAEYNFSNLQDTDRQNQNREYYGNAAPKDNIKTEPRYSNIDNTHEIDVFVKPSTRQTFANDYSRNIQPTTTNSSNYNRDSINLPELERNTTNTMHSVNVHKGGSGGKICILDDIKNTTKETMLYGDKSGQINSVIRQSDTILADSGISDYNFKTTQKEMMVDKNYIGQPLKNDQTGYTVNKYNAKTTHKETTSDNYYQGSGKGKENTMIYSTYQNPEKVRNSVHSINYKGNASIQGYTQEENRDRYKNVEINGDKEKFISNERANGPQSFNISGGVNVLGETSHRPNKEPLHAHIENVQNTSSNIPTKIEMGSVTHTAHNTYSENENTRETREFTNIIENQLKNNPFYNLRN